MTMVQCCSEEGEVFISANQTVSVLFSPAGGTHAAGLRGGPVEAADAEDAGAFKQRRICQLRC